MLVYLYLLLCHSFKDLAGECLLHAIQLINIKLSFSAPQLLVLDVAILKRKMTVWIYFCFPVKFF